MEPTPPDQSSGPESPYSFDRAQVDLVKSLLVESYSAKDVKEYPENNNGRELLKLYFSFENRNEARAFLEFIYESKYKNKGIHSKLRAHLLQTGKKFFHRNLCRTNFCRLRWKVCIKPCFSHSR